MERFTGKRTKTVWGILAALLILGGCFHYEAGVVPPTQTPEAAGLATSTPARTRPPTSPPTPGPSPTPLCAHARISGQTCMAYCDVTISSCCPDWSAITSADEVGAFEFDNVTAGEYTVSAGGRSRDVILRTCYSQVSVNLCPPPTHPPLAMR